MLDIFDGKLTLDNVLDTEIWLLDDLYKAQIEYLQEKRKAEEELNRKAREDALSKRKKGK